jgi:DNA-binding CsgD family transcriptional regulator
MPGGTMQGALRVVALALVRATEFDARTTKVDGLAQVCEAMAGAAERALGCSEDRPWLTPHEVAVLDRLANGHTVEEIAAALHRSPHTIHDHVKSLHRKLGVERRAMLVSLAMGVAGPLEREVGRDAARVVEAKPSSGEASEASWRGGDLGTTHA